MTTDNLSFFLQTLLSSMIRALPSEQLPSGRESNPRASDLEYEARPSWAVYQTRGIKGLTVTRAWKRVAYLSRCVDIPSLASITLLAELPRTGGWRKIILYSHISFPAGGLSFIVPSNERERETHYANLGIIFFSIQWSKEHAWRRLRYDFFFFFFTTSEINRGIDGRRRRFTFLSYWAGLCVEVKRRSLIFLN